jgi:hypothetical protein
MPRSLLVESLLTCPASNLMQLPPYHLQSLFFAQWKPLSVFQRRVRGWIMELEFAKKFLATFSFDLKPKKAQLKKLYDFGDIKPGDHVSLPRKVEIYEGKETVQKDSIHHHAIYVGEHEGERKFAEFNGDDKLDAKIVLTPIDVFFGNITEFYYIPYGGLDKDAENESRKVCLEAALTYAKYPRFFGDYCPFTNNCETFALVCKIGQRESEQVKLIFDSIEKDLNSEDSKVKNFDES